MLCEVCSRPVELVKYLASDVCIRCGLLCDLGLKSASGDSTVVLLVSINAQNML